MTGEAIMAKPLKSLIFLLTLVLASCGGNRITEFRAYLDPAAVSADPVEDSSIKMKIEIPSGSHIYANPKGPGTGKPTVVTASGPDAIVFGDVKYPAGERYTYPGDTEHVFVYSDKVEIVLPFTARKNALPGEYEISLLLDALLCTDTTCIPKKMTLPCTVKIEAAQAGITAGQTENPVAQPAQEQKLATVSSPVKSQDDHFRGMSFSPRCIRERSVTGLLQAVLFGLIAGFILNFMPCVLPVVSLKIMGFVKHAGSDRREMLKLGSLFSAGILASFMALAFLAAFFGYGWGELFQHRLFLIVMAGVVFALALSMFGLFTLNVPSFAGKAAKERDNRHADAFLKGLLATLLATPCSGPFLGGTLAWALIQPPHIIFITFMSIGAGMALPYMIISASPGLMRFVPKAGEWTRTFEQAMGFFLVFTAVYLLSLLESDSVMPGLTLLAFIALGLWQYGRYGSPIEKKSKRIFSLIALLAIIAGGYALSFHFLYTVDSADLKGAVFSEERVMSNRDSGRISMVQFTAEWCPNCKLVEARSLRTDRVARAVKENDVDYMIADITRENPAAERLLSLLGSRSIPVLAVIPAGQDFFRPVCLRDIYSEEDVINAIGMALQVENR